MDGSLSFAFLVLSGVGLKVLLHDDGAWRGDARRAAKLWSVAALICGTTAVVSGSVMAFPCYCIVAGALWATRPRHEVGGRAAGPPGHRFWIQLLASGLSVGVAYLFAAVFHPQSPEWVNGLACSLWSLTGAGPFSVERASGSILWAAGALFAWGGGTQVVRALLADVGLGFACSSGAESDGLLRAGRVIGNLERILVYVLITAGEAQVVGFVIAAKSLVRLSAAREAAEYYLVGTLASLAVALAAAMLVG